MTICSRCGNGRHRAVRNMAFDLILKGGRIIDPSQSVDHIADIAFASGKVNKIGTDLVGGATTDVRDISGYIVSPGLIDLHTRTCIGVGRHSVSKPNSSPG